MTLLIKLLPMYSILSPTVCLVLGLLRQKRQLESLYLRSPHTYRGEPAYKPVILIFYSQVYMRFSKDTRIFILNRLFCVSISSSIKQEQ